MKNDHDPAEKKAGSDRVITLRRFLKAMGSGAAIAAASDALTGRGTSKAEMIRFAAIVRVNLLINGHWRLPCAAPIANSRSNCGSDRIGAQ